jgi:hypothetical protein
MDSRKDLATCLEYLQGLVGRRVGAEERCSGRLEANDALGHQDIFLPGQDPRNLKTTLSYFGIGLEFASLGVKTADVVLANARTANVNRH